ncbi:MAG: glycosyltransferase [Acidobacteria bacterium]|nr:glycosyltransferase [Acidobacteriota bacterium]
MLRLDRQPERGVSIIVPCFNEERSIEATGKALSEAAARLDLPVEVIFVNDGSADGTAERLKALAAGSDLFRSLSHTLNRGYGAALKTGIEGARYDRIVITDADGTYPNERIPELVKLLDDADMAVGARQGAGGDSWIRTFVKGVLLRFGRLLSGAQIADINSGLRAMRVNWVRQFWFMLPAGFSFTTTITLAMHLSHLRVVYVPIDYRPRVGKSSIRPISDTVRIFSQVFRTVAYFRAFRVFSTIAVALLLSSVAAAFGTWAAWGSVAQVPTAALAITGALFFGMGLIGDLVNARRSL